MDTVKEKIKSVPLTDFVRKAMVRYGLAVNEDRSLPEIIDGLKPVQRRVLWAAYRMNLTKPVKTARIVGDVLGKYHPHGDKSVGDAIETMVTQSLPTMLGEGNWGSIVGDTPASMRYTNAMLSNYGSLVFFDPYYMPVVDLVPNYDGSEKEPVILPTLLPNLLLNGVSGIGVGVTSEIPSFTLKSVIDLLENMLSSAKKCTPNLCLKTLVYTTPADAMVNRKAQQAALLEFYKTGIGIVEYAPRLKVTNNEVHITGVAPFKGIDNYVSKILSLANSKNVSSFQDQCSQWKLWFILKPTKGMSAENLAAEVKKYLSSVKHFKINVTERKLFMDTGWPEVKVSFRKTNVPEIVNLWLEERTRLEIRATQYQLEVLQKQIRKNEVLRLAVRLRDFIISIIKNDALKDSEIKSLLMKKLEISEAEAAMLYDLKWRQLRSLEDATLVEQLKKQRLVEKQYEARIKSPEKAILESIVKIKTTLIKDKK